MELTSLDVSKDISNPTPVAPSASAIDIDDEAPATDESSPDVNAPESMGSGSGSGGEWETLTDEGKAAKAAQA